MEQPIKLNASLALCAQIDPDLWFSHDREGGQKASYHAIDSAKRFCSECPLTLKCLMVSVQNKEEYGIWGGSTARERRYITNVGQGFDFVQKLKKRYTK